MRRNLEPCRMLANLAIAVQSHFTDPVVHIGQTSTNYKRTKVRFTTCVHQINNIYNFMEPSVVNNFSKFTQL